MSYWKLASGAPSDPDHSWQVMPGTTIDLIERYFGVNIPLTDVDILQTGVIATLSDFLGKAETIIESMAARLSIQGPLAPYFDGIRYDAVEDGFVPTTQRQVAPIHAIAAYETGQKAA